MIKISPQKIVAKKNRILALIIHYFLKSVFLLYQFIRLNFSRDQKDLPFEEIKKILVIRIDGLGDVVMSTPAFKALRDIFSDAHITLLAAGLSKELVEVMPTFDEVIYFDAPWIAKEKKGKFRKLFSTVKRLRKKKIDLAIDLRGDFRNIILMYVLSAKYRLGFDITGCNFLLTHIVPCGDNHHPVTICLSSIKYLSQKDKGEHSLSLWITKKDREYAENLLENCGIDYVGNGDLVVIVHPGAKWYGRWWMPEGYAQIADRLIYEYEAKVILSGNSTDIEITQHIANLMKHRPVITAGKTSLRQFLALLEKSNLFIGVDSGPMHMAAGMGIKIVALFGPARPEAVGPWGNGHIVITKQDDFPCSPCAQTICKMPNNSCMHAITVEDVWEAVEQQVDKIFKERNLYENSSN
jgi:lipopolysaccharide heptosyltransferase II